VTNYKIRPIKPSEITLLKEFLYEAIFQRDENNLLPKEIIYDAHVYQYIDGFGKADDSCLVAEADGRVIGAVWTRILSGEVKGYGYIDNSTPEFAISLYKEYRNKGIGNALMQNMLALLRKKGYKKVSLSVQKDNYALRLYRNLGFAVLEESDEDYLMVYEF